MGFLQSRTENEASVPDVMQRLFLDARIMTEKDLSQSPGLIHSRQDHESVS